MRFAQHRGATVVVRRGAGWDIDGCLMLPAGRAGFLRLGVIAR